MDLTEDNLLLTCCVATQSRVHHRVLWVIYNLLGNYSHKPKFLSMSANLIFCMICFVGVEGLEPPKPIGERFTVFCNCHYAILPVVVGRGFEPLWQEWKSCILTLRWTDQKEAGARFELATLTLWESRDRPSSPSCFIIFCFSIQSFPNCLTKVRYKYSRVKKNLFYF